LSVNSGLRWLSRRNEAVGLRTARQAALSSISLSRATTVTAMPAAAATRLA
jgi:hypothetical protein